uniref:Helitron_like_N domain-containing protein n=1 Tax=Gongylonema pulchrum TaxID=637853 RepID=A0A183E6D1_9BILA
LERQRQLAAERKRRYRSSESYRQAERVRDAVAHRLLRSHPVSTASMGNAFDEPGTSRGLQQTALGISRSNSTQEASNSNAEFAANAVPNSLDSSAVEKREKAVNRMLLLRQDYDYKQRENTANREAMKKRRASDEGYKVRERTAGAEAKQQRRETDLEYRERERIANAEAMRQRRETDVEYQEMERIANAEAMRHRRQTDIQYQEMERIANAEAVRQRRQIDYLESERLVDAEIKQQRRAAGVEFRERERLDSVTCARYFNYRYQGQRKLWDLPDDPFQGIAITHSYYKVEFQQRGSTHIHQLLWLSDAPVFDTVSGQNEREVCNFIDRFIACSSIVDIQDQQGPSLSPHYLEFQYHRHADTCGKRKTGKCRFGIPFYPMRNTRILRPSA